MGETDGRENAESATRHWDAMSDSAERLREHGFGPLADKLRTAGPPRPSLYGTPVIIDTDIGGDPDDTVALICAARAIPELALVITSDEHDGERARLARHLLDLLDRRDVPVVRGAQLDDTRYWAAHSLIPDQVPTQPDNLVQQVNSICDTTDGPVRWAGMGPLTNLAHLTTHHHEITDRLVITQTGGAFNYRDPSRASHNFRLDPTAAITVVNNATDLHLVISDITTNDAIALRPGDDLHVRLAKPEAPPWAQLLRQHLDHWYADFHPFSHQHDPLTLTAAMRLPFVTFSRRRRFRIEHDARMFADPNGHTTRTAIRADYPAFLTWLNKQLAW